MAWDVLNGALGPFVADELNHGLKPIASDSVGLGFGIGVRVKTLRLRGTPAYINKALDGMLFYSDLHYRGPAAVSFIVSDLGFTDASFAQSYSLISIPVPPGAQSGRGLNGTSEGPLYYNATIPIIVMPVNRVPEWVVPPNASSLIMQENTELVIDGISVIDDNYGMQYWINITVGIGTVSITNAGLLTFVAGSGTLDSYVYANGTLDDINGALAGLVYKPPRYFQTTQLPRDNITLTITDNPAAGAGPVGGHNVTTIIYITQVYGLNTAPVITVPGMHVIALPCEEGPIPTKNVNVTCGARVSVDRIDVYEDIPSVIPVSIADLDIDYTYAARFDVTLSSPFGLLSLGSTAGLTFLRGDGVKDPIVRFFASVSATNAALAGLVYVSRQDYYGTDNITVTVSDQGYTGSGGAKWDSQMIPLTVWPMNDPVFWAFPVYTKVIPPKGVAMGCHFTPGVYG